MKSPDRNSVQSGDSSLSLLSHGSMNGMKAKRKMFFTGKDSRYILSSNCLMVPSSMRLRIGTMLAVV